MDSTTRWALVPPYPKDDTLALRTSNPAGQWLKACYGLVACTILVIFNGVGAFLERPFNIKRFISAYISVRLPFLPTYLR